MNRTFARGLGGVLLVSLVAACGGEEETAAGDDVSPQECATDLVELTDGDISAAALVERCGVSAAEAAAAVPPARSEEHTSELQSLMRNSYAVFCLKKKNT